jgi:hypothetical protein
MTTTAAPYARIVLALLLNSSSPPFNEILFTIHFPWQFYRPASMTSNLEESTMIGTLAISGSERAILMNLVIAFLPSIKPSSKLKSRIYAPFSTWSFATAIAAS